MAPHMSYIFLLRLHLCEVHAEDIRSACGEETPLTEFMDFYEEAGKIYERRAMPKTGLSVDRRVLAHVREVYRDEAVQTLICIVCAEKNMYFRGHDRFGVAAGCGGS